MCLGELEPQSKTIARKATVIGANGEIYPQVVAMGPVIYEQLGRGYEPVIRVYGNPKRVPNGAMLVRFQAVYDKKGERVL